MSVFVLSVYILSLRDITAVLISVPTIRLFSSPISAPVWRLYRA